MVVVASPKDLLVVKREGTSLVGISGHQVASLPANAEVRPQGERGAYTIVTWQGRMGFVLTDDLREFATVADQPQAVSVATADDQASAGARLGSLVLVAALALAGAASALYTFLAM